MGGVLFIDEAYYLYRADSKDYGQEAIDILLQVMENDRDKLVVILAGYKDRMDVFFDVNPGMSSRIAHHLDFAAYEIDELTAIGQMMLERSPTTVRGGGGGAARLADAPMRRAAVRQRPHRPQRARARAAAARAPSGPDLHRELEPRRPHAPGARGCRHPGVMAGPLPCRAAGPPRRADRPRAIRSPTPTSIQPRS